MKLTDLWSVAETFRKLTYLWIAGVIILALRITVSAGPGFNFNLHYPPVYISPLPEAESKFNASISYSEYEYPRFRFTLASKPAIIRSSFNNKSLTFSGAFYKKTGFLYEYVPRTVDAESFLQYRRKTGTERRMNESRSRALAKEQRDKRGGLLAINIPIKSKTMESLFGEGGAGLKVSGYHQISFSGRSQWDDRASTATYRQSKFPSLNMEQISRFDINGTIGSKISVSVSQDSKTDIPLANRLMIRYKGDEDDIIKTIEAGNTNLTLPNTQFVGYTSRIQGLFGIKSEAQIGGLKLTVIASQEKGSSERTTVDAGASASKTTIRDYEYLDGKIFDLGRPTDFAPGDVIQDIVVYKFAETNTGAGFGDTALMYVDPAHPELDTDESSKSIVTVVDANDYIAIKDEHWIMFNSPNAGSYNADIGVYMTIKKADGTIDTIGNISGKPYILKLIKHKTPNPSYITWNYVWRNVYSLRIEGTSAKGLEINIFKGGGGTEGNDENLDHQNGVPYIRILGLDRYDSQGNPKPDGLADINTPIYEPSQGLLIFPNRQPFNYSKGYADSTLQDTIPEIYLNDRNVFDAQKLSKYYIEVSSRSRASEISLGKPNIIDGSERITLNGAVLEKGTDYRIDYDFGRITFLKEEAVDPNNDLSIEFEYSPFIMAQKKSLFGVRGEYEISKDLSFGATVLYKSDKATDRKPKIGQETSKMFVWDADIDYRLPLNFLTKLANALPLYSTEAASNMSISAEVAQSYPNPNVDGVAYLDDFEGSRDSYSLGVYRENWYIGSRPVDVESERVRSKMVWFNPYEQIATEEIWDRQTAPGESGSQTLWLVMDPTKVDRRTGRVDTSITITDANQTWASIMRFLPAGSANQERAQLLEIRLRGERGILHIDLGDISEDANGNDSLSTEDKDGDGFLDEGEDIGQDGFRDSGEPGYDTANNKDPNGDNWYYDVDKDPDDYSRINGTENNVTDPGTSGRPDTEDINRSRILEQKNNYFSFRIDLSEDPATSRFYVEGSRNEYGWRSFRIPVRDSSAIDEIVGLPRWTAINYARIWLDSVGVTPDTVRIASAEIILPNWEDTLISPVVGDSARFNVAVINTQENSDIYQPPPGVSGNYDQANRLYEPEQSLMIHFENFKAYDTPGADTGIAERFLYDTPNLMGYKRLGIFIHGPSQLDSDSALVFFFRVGQDNKNYYELRRILHARPDDTGWIDAYMDFNDITGIKEYLERERKIDPTIDEKTDTIGANIYRVYGEPSITKVKYLAFGVVSRDPVRPASGDIWIDELRLTEVRRDVGLAARLTASGNVADLFTWSAGYNYMDSYFRKISASTRGGGQDNLGSGKSTQGYSMGMSFKLDMFLPRSLGAKLPVSLRYSKSTSIPRLRFNSDIILPEEFRVDEGTTSTSKSFSISESISKKTKNIVYAALLNNIKANFSYNRTEGKSPASPMSVSENYQIGSSYGFTLGKIPSVKPFFWTKPVPLLNKMSGNRFYFFPQSFSVAGNFDRNLRVSRNSSNILTNNLTRGLRGDMRIGYKIADNLNVNYGMNTRRDMSNPDLVVFSFNPKKLKLGRETNYDQSFGASYTPALFGFFTHKFSFATSYREDLNVTDNTRNMTASKSYGIGGALDLQKLFPKRSDKSGQTGLSLKGKEKPAADASAKKSAVSNYTGGAIAFMHFLTSWIEPITYDFKESYRYSYIGLMERAQMKFRFGITEDVGAEVDPETRAAGRSNSTSKSTSFAFGSGTKFFGGLKLGVTVNRAISRDIIKSVSPQKSIATTFPDINFSIGQMTTFKFLNSLISKFSPRTKYSRSTRKNINLSNGVVTSEATSTSQNPLLSFNFNLVKGVDINVATNRSKSEDKTYNVVTGKLTRRSISSSENATLSTKYAFSWPTGVRFPLLGRVKFSSTMAIAVEIAVQKQNREEQQEDLPMNSLGDNTNLTITPTISYSFSSQIRGGITGRWQDTNNNEIKRKSHVRELRIWVDIQF